MMRKLLVLVLVLGIASVANAALTIDEGAGSALPDGTLTIGIVSDDTSSWYGLLVIDPGGDGSLTNGVDLAAAGDLGSIMIFTYDIGIGFGYDMTADGLTVLPSAGTQFEVDWDTTGLMAGDSATISLYANGNTDTAVDTAVVTVIPEPMTVALLGLGGLFLLRRRK
jgi:hypothetical protein